MGKGRAVGVACEIGKVTYIEKIKRNKVRRCVRPEVVKSELFWLGMRVPSVQRIEK